MSVRRKARASVFAPLPTCAVGALLMASFQHQPVYAAEGSKAADMGDTVCLEWDPGVATDCPTVEQLETGVAEILGRPVVSQASCATRVSGAIRPGAAGGWTVELRFANRTGRSLGERSFEIQDASCSTLKEPLSLVIALMVEGRAADSTPFRMPRRPSPQSGAAATSRATTTTTTSHDLRELTVAGTVSSGLLPEVAFGATVGVGSRVIAGLPLRLETTFWVPTETSRPGPDGRFWSLLGDLGFCPSIFHTRRFAALACMRIIAGAIHGKGLGLGQGSESTRPFGAGELSAELMARVSNHLSAYLSVGVAAPWIRPRFVYRDTDDTAVLVHQPRAMIPVAALGVDFDLDSGAVHSGAAAP